MKKFGTEFGTKKKFGTGKVWHNEKFGTEFGTEFGTKLKNIQN